MTINANPIIDYTGRTEMSGEMDSSPDPTFTDGMIFLRPLSAEDAAAHLAGEDDEMAKWVSGGRSTMATVKAFIARSQES